MKKKVYDLLFLYDALDADHMNELARTIKTSVILKSARRFVRLLFSYETIFVLFLNAGRLKSFPLFSRLPVDLTILTFIICFLGYTWNLLIGKEKIRVTPGSGLLTMLTFLFAILAFISLLWTSSNFYSSQKILQVAILIPFCLFNGLYIIGPNQDRINRFSFLITLICFLYIFDAFTVFRLQSRTRSIRSEEHTSELQ